MQDLPVALTDVGRFMVYRFESNLAPRTAPVNVHFQIVFRGLSGNFSEDLSFLYVQETAYVIVESGSVGGLKRLRINYSSRIYNVYISSNDLTDFIWMRDITHISRQLVIKNGSVKSYVGLENLVSMQSLELDPSSSVELNSDTGAFSSLTSVSSIFLESVPMRDLSVFRNVSSPFNLRYSGFSKQLKSIRGLADDSKVGVVDLQPVASDRSPDFNAPWLCYRLSRTDLDLSKLYDFHIVDSISNRAADIFQYCALQNPGRATKGIFYQDNNCNASFDGDDILLNRQPFNLLLPVDSSGIQPRPIYLTTTRQGAYHLHGLREGSNYRIVPSARLNASAFPDTLSFIARAPYADSINIGYCPIAPLDSIATNLYTAHYALLGRKHRGTISTDNRGNTTLDYMLLPSIESANGDTIAVLEPDTTSHFDRRWKVNVTPGQKQRRHFTYQSAATPAGDSIHLCLRTLSRRDDTLRQDFTACRGLYVYSFNRPNHFRSTLINGSDGTAKAINYQIAIDNTVSDTANRVVVETILPARLDPATLRIINADTL